MPTQEELQSHDQFTQLVCGLVFLAWPLHHQANYKSIACLISAPWPKGLAQEQPHNKKSMLFEHYESFYLVTLTWCFSSKTNRLTTKQTWHDSLTLLPVWVLTSYFQTAFYTVLVLHAVKYIDLFGLLSHCLCHIARSARMSCSASHTFLTFLWKHQAFQGVWQLTLISSTLPTAFTNYVLRGSNTGDPWKKNPDTPHHWPCESFL